MWRCNFPCGGARGRGGWRWCARWRRRRGLGRRPGGLTVRRFAFRRIAHRARARSSLRARVAWATAVSVAVAAVGMAAFAYFAQHNARYSEVDRTLQAEATEHLHDYADQQQQDQSQANLSGKPRRGAGAGVPDVYLQTVTTDGKVTAPKGATTTLPVTARALAIARSGTGTQLTTMQVAGAPVRVLVVPARRGLALELASPVREVERALHRLGTELFAAGVAAVLLAAGLGWLVSGAAIAPLRRLSREAEQVAATTDLDHRISVTRTDELGRLAVSMNLMLVALGRSVRMQRQLVADASHELRTPLASLQTNAEVFARSADLTPQDRERLAAEMVGQVGELAQLLADITELARGSEPSLGAGADSAVGAAGLAGPAGRGGFGGSGSSGRPGGPGPAVPVDVEVDDVVAAELSRARRHWPGVSFSADLEPVTVPGDRTRIARAVSNLLDNAAKFSPDGAVVEVRLAGGLLAVRDHGPGIAAEDLPFVFDRFYRAADARGKPGSGLGLAIVRQVAESMGGAVVAEAPAGGGTRLVFDFGPRAVRVHSQP